MAALDGKIIIEKELRPCIVTFVATGRNMRGEIIKREFKALFHCWNHRSELVGESCLRGGHSAGQVSDTFAIVEYEDGTVHEVEPENIQFVDNAMSEYAFPEMEKNTDK